MATSTRQRWFDLTCATTGAALYAPFFALVAILILLEDGCPVGFYQRRIGHCRRPFTVMKWRTMRNGRVTRVGRWLRATGLDETLQFINVLNGSMRMVGPRPLTDDDVARLGWNDPAWDVRFSVPPGITGLAQLYGGINARHSFRLDCLYLRRASVWLDVKLVALSLLANLLGKRRIRRARTRIRRCRQAGALTWNEESTL